MKLDPERRAWLLRRLRTLAGLVLLVAIVISLDALHAPLMRLLETTEQLIGAYPVGGALVFVLFSALSGMLAFFSSAVVVPVGVVAWGPVLCGALLWLGWILGGVVSYTVGRTLGRPVVALVTSRELLERFEHKVTARTSLGAALLLQLALPSEVPGYLLGLAKFGLLRYLAVLAVAELPYAVGTVVLGESFVRQRVLPFVGLGLLAVAVGGWAWSRLHHRLESGESD